LVDNAKVERLEALFTAAGRSGPRAGARPEVFTAQSSVIESIVGFSLHRGVVAVAQRGLPLLADTVAARANQMLIVEGVNDADNLGALYRNAAALGVQCALADPTTCDHLARRTVRVSMGYAATIPTARLSWPDGLAALRERGVTIVALTPHRDAQQLHTVERTDRMALLVGAEGPGLTRAALEAASFSTRIPMAPGTDSLNVATAAAIAAYQLFSE
jgi:tRNA G18 (ribose-2'-O)-methylase SpoU